MSDSALSELPWSGLVWSGLVWSALSELLWSGLDWTVRTNKFKNSCLKIDKGDIPVNYTSVNEWHGEIM